MDGWGEKDVRKYRQIKCLTITNDHHDKKELQDEEKKEGALLELLQIEFFFDLPSRASCVVPR